MKQADIILKYIRDCGGWVMEGKISGIQTKWGFIGFRGPRTVRNLIAAKKLEKKPNEKYCLVRIPQSDIVSKINAMQVYKPIAPPEQKQTSLFALENKLITLQ